MQGFRCRVFWGRVSGSGCRVLGFGMFWVYVGFLDFRGLGFRATKVLLRSS